MDFLLIADLSGLVSFFRTFCCQLKQPFKIKNGKIEPKLRNLYFIHYCIYFIIHNGFFYEIIEDTADGMWLTNGPMTLSNIEQLRTQKSHCGGRGSDGNNRF